jgi:flagellar biosynthetic protein FlhB
MAEGQDRENVTEQATEKKLQDSIDRGEFPISREVNTLFFLAALYFLLTVVIAGSSLGLINVLAINFENAAAVIFQDDGDAKHVLGNFMLDVVRSVAIVPLVLIAAGILAHVSQTQIRFSPERIKPQFNRLSPMGGFKKLASLANLMEFGKSVFKLAIVGAVATSAMFLQIEKLQQLVDLDPVNLPGRLVGLVTSLTMSLATVMVLFVVVDVVVSRIRWHRGLRMTKQEVREEHKEMEGDPHIRARRLSIGRARVRQRMMVAVPKATVVIANPTHYAVALRYNREEESAPRVVARGRDLLALRIREIAEDSGVPVIEDKPLARSLYQQVAVDQVIPREFYRAVADVIIILQKRAKKPLH